MWYMGIIKKMIIGFDSPPILQVPWLLQGVLMEMSSYLLVNMDIFYLFVSLSILCQSVCILVPLLLSLYVGNLSMSVCVCPSLSLTLSVSLNSPPCLCLSICLYVPQTFCSLCLCQLPLSLCVHYHHTVEWSQSSC